MDWFLYDNSLRHERVNLCNIVLHNERFKLFRPPPQCNEITQVRMFLIVQFY